MQQPRISIKEDLLTQSEASNVTLDGNMQPAAQVIRVGKRKPDSVTSNSGSLPDNAEKNGKPKSRFSQIHSKKKKESYVDHTVLLEAEKLGTSVLKRIVERDVPSLSPLLAHWEPVPSPNGYPEAKKHNLPSPKSEKTSTLKSSSVFHKQKTLYKQEFEKELISERECEEKSLTENVADDNLMILGAKSYILDGKSGLGKTDDALAIHEENMKKLSTMTHEQRLQEREELLSKLSEEQVKFLISLRKKKEAGIAINKKKDFETMKMEVEEDKEEIRKEEAMNSEQSLKEDEINISDKVENEEEEMEQDVLPLSELPIPPEAAKKWLHMDKVELDKLKWMSDVPQPKPLNQKGGHVARFNLQGDLLPFNSDISWREGLHHHGDEPGRAGYSLDELVLFVRSQVIQQRHLGLNTLGFILRNAAEGLYDSCFDVPIIQLMVDAGLVLLLRFALDETSAIVYTEALRSLYCLIGCEPDEMCLTIAEPWTPLGVQPGFSSLAHSKEKDREELDAEEKELKDVEVIKLDVIRALVRMDVHVRLRYLLETGTLSPPDVIHTFGILRRIARHSLTAAWTLMRTPRLIEVIVRHFLPHDITPLLIGKNVNQLTSVYDVPLSQALTFLKVLASKGRHIAATLLETHDLMSRLMVYAAMDPTEIQMPIPEVLNLSKETFYLWSIFLSYGLVKVQEGFHNFYPLFFKQLYFYRDKLDINKNVESNQYNYEIGAHFANVLTKGLCVASTESLLSSRMKNNEGSVRSNNGKNLVIQPPILEWKIFRDIFELIEICLFKWLSQLSDISEITFSGYKLLGSFCSFYSVYLENWRDQKEFSGVEFIKKMNTILPLLVVPFQNKALNFILKQMRNNSALCSSLKLGTCRDVPNLGSLYSICHDGEVTPILQKTSPFSFILPYTKLLKTVCTFYPTIDPSYFSSFLNNLNLKIYLSDICNSSHSISSQWFSRAEIYSVTYILQMANSQSCDDVKLFHRTALTLLPLVHRGDEHIIKSLLNDIICNPKFLEDISTVESHIKTLTVKEFKPLKSPSIQQPIVSTLELTKKILDVFPSFSMNFIKNMLHSKQLEKSSIAEKCVPFLMNDLTINREEMLTVVDHYWSLAPLKMLMVLNDAKEDKNNQIQPEIISSAINWMQMTFFLLKYRNEVCLKHTSSMGWISQLSLVFLVSNDLFLDANISSYVQASVIAIMENGGYDNLDPSWTLPDFPPILEWYNRMVEQFGSNSYGDSTFAFFIILPLLRCWPTSFRLALFGDSSIVLRFIRLTSEEVSQFIPIERFLDPPEDDQNVIYKYISAMEQKLVSKHQTPFLYDLANHHILKFNKSVI